MTTLEDSTADTLDDPTYITHVINEVIKKGSFTTRQEDVVPAPQALVTGKMFVNRRLADRRLGQA